MGLEATARFWSMWIPRGVIYIPGNCPQRAIRRTTNNRMELMAVIAGLEALNRPCQVELYSDCEICGGRIQPSTGLTDG